MTKNELEAFLRTSFFHALSSQEKPVNRDILFDDFKKSFEVDFQYQDRFYKTILEEYAAKVNLELLGNVFKTDYILIVKQVILDFLIQEDCLKYFCLEEEYTKLLRVIGFKQYNSKLVISVLGRVAYIAESISYNYETLTSYLYSDIKRKIADYNDSYVIKTMGKFKDKIDKITSGVNVKCYLDFADKHHFNDFPKELNDYMKEKHGYIYSNDSFHYSEKSALEEILSLSLENDDSLWILNGMSRKTIFSFVNLVFNYNGLKHAEKIIDYAFSEACKNERIKYLYDTKQPFYLCDVEEQMYAWCLKRLSAVIKAFDFKGDEIEAKGLVYPAFPDYDKEIEEGKNILDAFLKRAYFEEYDKIKSVFSNVDSVIQDRVKIDDYHFKNKLTLRTMIEYDLMGLLDDEATKKFLNSFYPNYYTNENMLDRFYYRLYLISKYTPNELLFDSLYEYLYSMLRMMDVKYKLKSSFVYDTKLREEKYSILKTICAKYGYNLDDKFKQEYINALLDRKYATIEETEKFPEYEQYGDAIYDLAVNNIIFYDPDYKAELTHQEREKYVKADAQVKVSKTIGFDKAYISGLTDSINNKLTYDETVDFLLSPIKEGHFLADSLEMILAVMAKQFGLNEILKFAARIIVETNPELTMPVIYEFDYIKLFNDQSYDKYYLDKIYPGPFSEGEHYHEYQALSYSISKILKIRIIGNETKEKRQFIADSYSIQNKKTNQYYEPFQFVYWYLTYGIEETIKKFKDVVESSYIEE